LPLRIGWIKALMALPLTARGFRVSRVPRGFSCAGARETGNFSLQIETTPLLENILKI